jgi:hypothetical protein
MTMNAEIAAVLAGESDGCVGNPMTAREIQNALFREYGHRMQIAMPNYTPKNWFECDLFAATKAGFMYEYEVKLSAADFKADAGKECVVRRGPRNEFTESGRVKKHALLAEGFTAGPVQFWYVMPRSVAEAVVLPAWAGLIVVEQTQWKVVLASRADGPRLHNTRLNESVIAHARSVCYWRFWNERNTLDRYIADRKKMAEAPA